VDLGALLRAAAAELLDEVLEDLSRAGEVASVALADRDVLDERWREAGCEGAKGIRSPVPDFSGTLRRLEAGVSQARRLIAMLVGTALNAAVAETAPLAYVLRHGERFQASRFGK
jgi:hypothetical protein